MYLDRYYCRFIVHWGQCLSRLSNLEFGPRAESPVETATGTFARPTNPFFGVSCLISWYEVLGHLRGKTKGDTGTLCCFIINVASGKPSLHQVSAFQGREAGCVKVRLVGIWFSWFRLINDVVERGHHCKGFRWFRTPIGTLYINSNSLVDKKGKIGQEYISQLDRCTEL